MRLELADLAGAPVVQALAWTGLGCTLLGAGLAAHRRDARGAAAWRWLRGGFLLLTVALALGALAWMEGGTFGRRQGGLSVAWILGLAALHLHHTGAGKGARALAALILAWAVAVAALLIPS